MANLPIQDLSGSTLLDAARRSEAEQLLANRSKAHEQMTDYQLANMLHDALPKLGDSDRSFAKSLFDGFTKYRRFTPKQLPYVVKLINRAIEPVKPREVPASDPSKWVSLETLQAGRYAVEQRRYRVNRPKADDSKWIGWTFVDDGSEYGRGEKYGKQRPGSKILEVTARNADLVCRDLRSILADPRAAMAHYGHITGTCGVCGRTLEDPESVARGIGPVCAEKF